MLGSLQGNQLIGVQLSQKIGVRKGAIDFSLTCGNRGKALDLPFQGLGSLNIFLSAQSAPVLPPDYYPCIIT